MPDKTAPPQLRPLITRSIDIARARGARSVEAEHLLLAILADPGLPASQVFTTIGLPREFWERMLREERALNLRAAGIEAVDDDRLSATRHAARPRWGVSVREALKRASMTSRARGHHHTNDVDVALGVLAARVGTVPRLLALGGIDADALARTLRAT